MTSERRREAERLFRSARDLPADRRAPFLSEVCGTDAALRGEVEGLLAQSKSDSDSAAQPGLAVADTHAALTDEKSALLVTGKQLGVYKITGRLGAGGMGEVFRARDTRLGREVAIKILPRGFTTHHERLARFEREARVLAALNHPNIAAIYGLEEAHGTPALVLELVDGEMLTDRIARGPISAPDAMAVARQIGDALAAAHGKGIVHRDLKPRNIALTRDGTVKVLDFGLAKAGLEDDAAPGGSAALTMSVGGTLPGMVLGTAAYMSPEQARGQVIDRRTDIWAFGCVLYEMLTARAAFAGETIPDIVAAVLEREPDWDALPPLTPRPVRRLLEHCLTKNRDERLGDISQARSALESSSSRSRVPARALAFAAIAATLVGAAAVWMTFTAPAPSPVPVQITRFATAVRDPALSPDGRMLAYVVQEPQSIDSQIWVQSATGGQPQQLTRAPGRKAWPAFSPDGSQIAFTLTGEEWKWDTWVVPIVGGEAPRLLLPNAHELQWIDNDRVLFSEFKRGIQVGVVVARAGRSEARDLYVPPTTTMAHVSDLSPDGRMVAIGQMGPLECFVMPFDGSGTRRPVGTTETPCAMFVRWSPDGRWLYFASGRAPDFQLFRQPAAGGRAEQLTFDRGLAGIGVVTWFALTGDGRSVIYPSGEARESVWLQRAGENEQQLTFEGDAREPAFSADGRRVVYLSGPRFSPGQMWMRSLDGSSSVQVAPDFRAVAFAPSPDGTFIAFAAPDAHKKNHLWLASMDNSRAPREIDVADRQRIDDDGLGNGLLVAPDNKTVFYIALDAGASQIWRVDTDRANRRPVTEREPSLRLSSISPDGRWISVTRGARTPREEWIYPADGGQGRRLFSGWRFRWMPGNRNFLLLNSGMVSTAWLVPNPTGADFPTAIPENPSAEILTRLGARKVLTADFFAEPFPGPDSSSVVYSKIENRSNLFQLALPH